MRKKIDNSAVSKENLLGFDTEFDLYSKLFEKSVFIFPEYETRARKGVSKHMANLLALGVYSGERLVDVKYNFNTRNIRLVNHLTILAEKGFVVYARKQNKGKLKLNIQKIKLDWLNADHQKTEDEFYADAFRRINVAMKNILSVAQNYNCMQIAAQLEFLFASLESSVKNSTSKETDA